MDYEFFDLFEVGNAGETIEAKVSLINDETGGSGGPEPMAFEEE
jgi:hypothetical protein